MDTKKLAKMIKETKTVSVITTSDGSGVAFQLVGDGSAYYRIENMPIMEKISMLTFLGLEEEVNKINYQETNNYGQKDLGAGLYQDYFEGEELLIGRRMISNPDIRMMRGGEDPWNDTVVFTMANQLAPVKFDGDTEEYLRQMDGKKMVAIKNGMLLKALLPTVVIEPELYLRRLQEETRWMCILEKRRGDHRE